jgi:all-trans-retinol 13,14-reductase
MKYDYAIIGAGVSGMTAAIILAQKGYRTALIEKSDTTGPTIRGFTRHDVFFDTGFHYTGALGEGEPLDRLFRYVGISGKIQKIFFKGNGVDLFHCLEPAFELSCCCGLENIRMKLGEAFPREENAVTAYLQMIWDAYQRLPYINLEREMTSFAFPLGIHEESLAEVLDKLTANTMLKAVLSMYCLLHGVAPREVPITFHAGVVASYYESVHGIAGGGRRLAEAFDERLHESGVDVYCGSRAEELLLSETHHITGIRLEDGNRIECTGAIVTIHPNSLLEIVPDRTFRPAYWTNLAALEDTPSAIILFGICREPVKVLHHTNIFAFPSEETSFCVREGVLEESPLFITGAKTESTHDGAHGFIVICPMPNLRNALWSQYGTDTHASDYSLFKERITRQLRTQIEAVIPELKGNISYVECATPYTLRRFTNSPTGSLYGVKHKVGQLNPIPLTKITNLYLAGQAVTAPGILGTMMSAFLACGYIVGHETLRKELRQCA